LSKKKKEVSALRASTEEKEGKAGGSKGGREVFADVTIFEHAKPRSFPAFREGAGGKPEKERRGGRAR